MRAGLMFLARTSDFGVRYPSTMLRMVPLPTGFAGREDEKAPASSPLRTGLSHRR